MATELESSADGHPLAAFLAESRRFLADEYPAKLRKALEQLPPEDLWWRPGHASNSVGNLLLHLAGNVRQWVVHGLGGEKDVRDRAGEFAQAGGSGLDEVWAELERALADADRVLAGLSPEALVGPRRIQGMKTTGMAALYHVVEHFSTHLGQILYIVKMRTDTELGFYQVDDRGNVTGTRW